MPRIALEVTEVRPAKGEAGYEPRMPRDRLKRLTGRLVVARSLKHAASILRGEAEGLGGDWEKYMLRLAEGLERVGAKPNVFETPFPVFVDDGNTKLPFTAFSALPEFSCPGAGSCLEWCYSFTAWRYPAAWARQVQNTLLLRFARRVVAHWFAQLEKDLTVRLYVDGDFDSIETIGFWFSLLKSRPDIRAYGYSKSWDLLWKYAQDNELPTNYMLNLSSGGKSTVTAEQMRNLSITRGEFLAVTVDYRHEGHKGRVGFARYDDPAYHRAVRKAAQEQLGLARVFSCPGKCGECTATGQHACGSDKFRNLPICIGVH